MPVISPCPTAKDWQQFVLGCLSRDLGDQMGSHLEQCPRCLDTMTTLHGEDTFTEAFRRPVPEIESMSPEVLQRLANKLQELQQSNQVFCSGTSVSLTASNTQAEQPDLSFLSAAQSPDELGRLGSYRVLKILGAGGMGMVFKAEDLHLQRQVALKVMVPELAAKPAARQRFLREARAAAAIEHDHIVSIFQVGEDNGVPFLAMPLLKGMSLEERLKVGAPLSLIEVVRLANQVAEGLAAAHDCGMIHRDIKPGNLWLEASPGRESGEFRVKILDFGLARPAQDDARLTQSGAILGTPAYMAPEQARSEPLDGRADLFSLGCVLYRLLTGRLPFRGDNTMAVLSSLALDHPDAPQLVNFATPTRLSDLVMRLLSKNPADRSASARDLVRELTDVEASLANNMDQTFLSTGRTNQPVAPGGQNCQPRTARRWLIAAALLLVLGPIAYLYSGTILRFATNKGELIVDMQDPNVVVSIEQNKVKLHDKTGLREFTLEAGDGEILVYEKDGVGPLATKKFSLNRGGKTTVTVTFAELAEAKKTLPANLPDPKKHPADQPPAINPKHTELVGVGPVPAGKSPFDALRREDIPAHELAAFGGASPVQPPEELVAILGDSRMTHWTGSGELKYSPKGDLLATRGWDGLRIWDTATGRQKYWFPGSACAFSWDGKRLAFCAADAISVVDLVSGKVVKRIIEKLGSRISDLAFTADDSELLFVQETAVIRHDLSTGASKILLAEEKLSNLKYYLKSDGKSVVSFHYLGKVLEGKQPYRGRILDLATGKAQLSKDIDSWTVSATFSPDGKYVFGGLNQGHQSLLWNLEANELTDFYRGSFNSGAFHPTENKLAIAGQYAIEILDLAAKKSVKQIPITGFRISGLAFSPDGKTLAVTRGPLVVFFETATWTERTIPALEQSAIRQGRHIGIDVSPDGETIIAGSHTTGVVNLWQVGTRKVELLLDVRDKLDAMAVSPDGRSLAALARPASRDYLLHVWDLGVRSERAKLVLPLGQNPPQTLAFTPDSKSVLAVPHRGANLRMIDVANPFVEPRVLRLTDKSGFGAGLVTPTWNGKVFTNVAQVGNGQNPMSMILDLATGLSKPWPGMQRQTEDLACSSLDGKLLAMGNREIQIFDANQNLVTKINPGVYSLFMAFSPNSKLLVCGNHNQILLADPYTGKVLRRVNLRKPTEPSAIPYQSDVPVAFAPDGRHLVVGNPNGTIYVFRLAAAVEGKAKSAGK